MQPQLDHESPVPLYHQLAEAIRYRIATGDLKAGAVLPPLRRAAAIWGVNLHTVRRAYAELSRLGVVTTSAPMGTRVLSGAPERPARGSASARDRFIRSIVSDARLRYGLSVGELIGLLRAAKPAPPTRNVSVVECSATQCEDLAGQIEEGCGVGAVPWPLSRREAPPAGPIVATYFHYNDVRLRWPERLSDVRFLAISPEAGLSERLREGRPRAERRIDVILCEREEAMARNIEADLVRVLPAREFRVRTRVVPEAVAALRTGGPREAILLSPRMWGELPAEARRDPRIHQVRYVFDPRDLDALSVDLGGRSR